MATRILALGTAVPTHVLDQAAVRDWARHLFDSRVADFERLLPAFANAGVETRHSCVPLAWYDRPHGWAEKNRLYLEHAVDLAAQAARACLDRAGVDAGAVDAVVAVSTTGIATPSLDARLIEPLGLRADVIRLPVFGLGCAGGVLGLARAAALARATPGHRVLVVVVELCGLTFRRDDRSKSNVIATVLFGDGAAAALLTDDDVIEEGPVVADWGEHTWPDSLDVMGWRIEEDGFGVLFSRNIPNLVRQDLKRATEAFLAARGLTLADIDGLICHPGGAKVIAAIEETFGLGDGALVDTRAVLRDYGNMSAATVLFVLDRVLAGGRRGRYLMSALGPGFTAGLLTLEVP